ERDREGSKALLTERQCRFGPCRGRYDFTARGIGRHAVQRSPEQDRDRLAGGLADDVPERRLEGPVAPGMECDGVQAPNVARDLKRISADEELRVWLEAVHRVAGAKSHQALVGLDTNDGGVEAGPGNRVPGGPERRVEGQPQPLELDPRDLHNSSASPGPGAASSTSRTSIAAPASGGR